MRWKGNSCGPLGLTEEIGADQNSINTQDSLDLYGQVSVNLSGAVLVGAEGRFGDFQLRRDLLGAQVLLYAVAPKSPFGSCHDA